jgi:RimJ/RimL family protein N-acetyltransferase
MFVTPCSLLANVGNMLPLHTPRLTVRMMRGSDIALLVDYRNDPAIGTFQDWELPFTDAAARRMIDEQAPLDGPTDGAWVQLAVELAASGEVVGDVAVQLSGGGVFATLGYTFAAEHHGRGYATEAAGAVIDELCARGVHRFVATLDPENVPSMRVLEALGFTVECLARQAADVRGEWVDDLRYAMLASERHAWRTREQTPLRDVRLVALDADLSPTYEALVTHHSQQRFVRPVVRSLAQMAFPLFVRGAPFHVEAFGVEGDGQPVGFVQLADRSATHDEPYVWRLLIDRRFQRRGAGRRVLQLVADRTRAAGHRTLLVSWGEGPGSPGPLYRAFGFVPTGEISDGETVARLAL